mmetsp:Transcript_19809/g.46369  ORF Transcript_19809/g.46369 Transcript_19809/m.46369 type:complete len:863 (-) Transcript_19809:542-3130(-)|eukprot:CAMPEP_0197186468 /NCGR_PEP_ID=MMETSP1423-20130617/14008_1 /TAXON_ID=476441 /ORGANISM="Pseudo-nitzschia heimii, Strain UNC1101" /LENGTH=862 /DNA_ID=CAMNT_0042637801 /DNA_START=468 /DNA_END=3056 /DNA_ORIENTATION=+
MKLQQLIKNVASVTFVSKCNRKKGKVHRRNFLRRQAGEANLDIAVSDNGSDDNDDFDSCDHFNGEAMIEFQDDTGNQQQPQYGRGSWTGYSTIVPQKERNDSNTNREKLESSAQKYQQPQQEQRRRRRHRNQNIHEEPQGDSYSDSSLFTKGCPSAGCLSSNANSISSTANHTRSTATSTGTRSTALSNLVDDCYHGSTTSLSKDKQRDETERNSVREQKQEEQWCGEQQGKLRRLRKRQQRLAQRFELATRSKKEKDRQTRKDQIRHRQERMRLEQEDLQLLQEQQQRKMLMSSTRPHRRKLSRNVEPSLQPPPKLRLGEASPDLTETARSGRSGSSFEALWAPSDDQDGAKPLSKPSRRRNKGFVPPGTDDSVDHTSETSSNTSSGTEEHATAHMSTPPKTFPRDERSGFPSPLRDTDPNRRRHRIIHVAKNRPRIHTITAEQIERAERRRRRKQQHHQLLHQQQHNNHARSSKNSRWSQATFASTTSPTNHADADNNAMRQDAISSPRVRSKSLSRSKSRSRSKSKSRSKSRPRSKVEARSSKSKSRSKCRSQSKSRSRERSRSKSMTRSKSKSRSKSRSRSSSVKPRGSRRHDPANASSPSHGSASPSSPTTTTAACAATDTLTPCLLQQIPASFPAETEFAVCRQSSRWATPPAEDYSRERLRSRRGRRKPNHHLLDDLRTALSDDNDDDEPLMEAAADPKRHHRKPSRHRERRRERRRDENPDLFSGSCHQNRSAIREPRTEGCCGNSREPRRNSHRGGPRDHHLFDDLDPTRDKPSIPPPPSPCDPDIGSSSRAIPAFTMSRHRSGSKDLRRQRRRDKSRESSRNRTLTTLVAASRPYSSPKLHPNPFVKPSQPG